MQRVMVLDNKKNPLMPCHPTRARQLLKRGKAAVFRRYPFIIILKYREGGDTQNIKCNIDPGSKQTGISLVADTEKGQKAVWAGVLKHRGEHIKMFLIKRQAIRRSRRNQKTRYRKPRFSNRTRSESWLSPSLESRVSNVITWVNKLSKWSPVNAL